MREGMVECVCPNFVLVFGGLLGFC